MQTQNKCRINKDFPELQLTGISPSDQQTAVLFSKKRLLIFLDFIFYRVVTLYFKEIKKNVNTSCCSKYSQAAWTKVNMVNPNQDKLRVFMVEMTGMQPVVINGFSTDRNA